MESPIVSSESDVGPRPEVLFADDDEAMRAMVAATLRKADYEVRLARNGDEAIDEVRRRMPDVIVLDYRMGIPNGFEVCERLKNDPRFSHLPVLILTAEHQIEHRLTGFHAGADDYLPKPFDPRELLARVRALLRLARRGLDRNPTSGLPGGEAIGNEFDRRQARGDSFAVCYLDLDNFKAFNDRFGFSVADAVIREVGEVLSRVIEGTDTFAGHVGGDDFILLSRTEDARRLAEAAQSLLSVRLTHHLPPDVVRAEKYTAMDRSGIVREYSLTRLSAAIMHLGRGSRATLPTIGERVAQVKQRAKRPGGTGIEEEAFPG